MKDHKCTYDPSNGQDVCDHVEATPKQRLEELRSELRAERISYGELAELQGLAEFIDDNDVELLEPAGVPEGVLVSEANTLKKYCTTEQLREILDTWDDDTTEYATLKLAIKFLEG